MVELFKYFDNVIFIACGILGLLFAYRKWPEKPEKKKEWDSWHGSYGTILKIISPIIIIGGLFL
jgi:uncharacterized membrane protein